MKNIPDGEIYHVITVGQGVMMAYGGIMRPEDRWKIVMYVRRCRRSEVMRCRIRQNKGKMSSLKFMQSVCTDSTVTNHLNMEDRFKVAPWFNYLCYALIAIGIITFVCRDFFIHPEQTWANYLLNNFYFLALAIGASFLWHCNILPSQDGQPDLSGYPRPWLPIFRLQPCFFCPLFWNSCNLSLVSSGSGQN